MRTDTLAAGDNFLIPNGTIIAELLIFAVTVFIVWRFVVPPITTALDERAERIRQGQADADEATEKLRAADASFQQSLSEARSEATEIRDGARSSGKETVDELRAHASSEVAETRREGEQQLAQQRELVTEELRRHVGEYSERLTARVLGTPGNPEAPAFGGSPVSAGSPPGSAS